MNTIFTVTEFRKHVYRLIDETSNTHEPITILGKCNNAVLLSESDWNAIQETLTLVSIPKMRESIRDGLETPLSDCSDELEW